MRGTKEFHELIDQFEKDFIASDMYVSARNPLQRASKESKYIYDNGEVNKIFNAYIMGYSYRKSIELGN